MGLATLILQDFEVSFFELKKMLVKIQTSESIELVFFDFQRYQPLL